MIVLVVLVSSSSSCYFRVFSIKLCLIICDYKVCYRPVLFDLNLGKINNSMTKTKNDKSTQPLSHADKHRLTNLKRSRSSLSTDSSSSFEKEEKRDGFTKNKGFVQTVTNKTPTMIRSPKHSDFNKLISDMNKITIANEGGLSQRYKKYKYTSNDASDHPESLQL